MSLESASEMYLYIGEFSHVFTVFFTVLYTKIVNTEHRKKLNGNTNGQTS